MTGMVVLAIYPDLAGHLEEAVNRQRQVLDRFGRACPPELEQIEQAFSEIATGGHGRSRAVTARRRANVSGVNREWFTPADAADHTGLSESTIRRRIADGSLPSSKIGRNRRISREALDEFMNARRAA